MVGVALLLCPRLLHAVPTIEFILDGSASMGQGIAPHRPFDEAQRVLALALSRVPAGAKIGVRVFGLRESERLVEKSCRDTELVVPFGANRELSLGESTPQGRTALGAALRAAAQDLAAVPEGERAIVVLSDGQDTCGQAPLEIVGDLRRSGFQVTIHTIGFGADAASRKELAQVAERTGGVSQSIAAPKDLPRAVFGTLDLAFKKIAGVALNSLGDLHGFDDAPATPERALRIDEGEHRDNFLGLGDAIDTYQFTAARGEKYLVELELQGTGGGALTIQAKAPDGTSLATATTDQTGSTGIDLIDLPAGPIAVIVSGGTDAELTRYTLRLRRVVAF